MMGDLRYVTPVNYASFADGILNRRRKTAYDEYVRWSGTHASVTSRASPAHGVD